jgi:hypothetical protein
MIKSLAASLLLIAFTVSAVSAQSTSAPATPSPLVTTSPVPAPPSNLIQYTGQLLDYRTGYVYFTNGNAFPIVDAPRVIDYFTGEPTTVAPQAKMFARATFDPATKTIIELAITKRRLQTSLSLAAGRHGPNGTQRRGRVRNYGSPDDVVYRCDLHLDRRQRLEPDRHPARPRRRV